VAAPASWSEVNLAKQAASSAASQIGLKGVSASTLLQDLESLQKLHAVFVVDVKTGANSPQHFSPNLNAYCVTSGVTDVGAAGVPLLKSSAESDFAKSGAMDIIQQDITIGGVPGVETSYHLSSSGSGTLDGSQLEVLPKADKACFVTLTVSAEESAGNILAVAAQTAQFP
jgi:hypothetical protein